MISCHRVLSDSKAEVVEVLMMRGTGMEFFDDDEVEFGFKEHKEAKEDQREVLFSLLVLVLFA